MQNLHVNTIIAKFFVGQNIVTSQKQTHDLRFFGGATGVVGQTLPQLSEVFVGSFWPDAQLCRDDGRSFRALAQGRAIALASMGVPYGDEQKQ